MLKKLICLLVGHDEYSYKVEDANNKIFEVKYCVRCDKETHKEVK